jgi:hypothetical protein
MLSAALCAGVLLGALSLAAKPPDLPLTQKDTLAPPPEEVASDCPSGPGAFADGTLLGTVKCTEPCTGSLLSDIGFNWDSGASARIVRKECYDDDFGAEDEEQEKALLEVGRLGTFSLLAKPLICIYNARDAFAVSNEEYSRLIAICPLSAVYRLRPTARRHFIAGLLFGINPLLVLVPTEKMLDTPEDHPPPKKAETMQPTSLIAWAETPPSPPAPAPSVCPWLARPTVNRGVQRVEDLDLSHDVLANLERLLEADRLMATARELRRAGYVWEALECYDVVYRLCPGSSFEDRVCRAVADMFAQCADRSEVAEAGEELKEVEVEEVESSAGAPWADWETVKKWWEGCCADLPHDVGMDWGEFWAPLTVKLVVPMNLPHDVCLEVGACRQGLRLFCRIPSNGLLYHLSYGPEGFDAWVTTDGGSP